jgi:hypothetical protein
LKSQSSTPGRTHSIIRPGPCQGPASSGPSRRARNRRRHGGEADQRQPHRQHGQTHGSGGRGKAQWGRTHALARDERAGMMSRVGGMSGRRESCWKALAGLQRVEPIPDWASGRYSLYRHRNFDRSGCVGRRGVRHEGFTNRPQPTFSRAQRPLKRPQAANSPCPARTEGSAARQLCFPLRRPGDDDGLR